MLVCFKLQTTRTDRARILCVKSRDLRKDLLMIKISKFVSNKTQFQLNVENPRFFLKKICKLFLFDMVYKEEMLSKLERRLARSALKSLV